MTTQSRYIFATSTGVYATDGTAAGTILLQATGADFVPQPGTQMVTLPNGEVLFFALANPTLDPIGAIIGGIEFWETDGTPAGTTEVGSTSAPDGLETPGDTIRNVVAIGSQVSFAFNIPGSGTETYLTNGTTAGTTVQDGGLLPATGLPATSAVVGSPYAAKAIFATSAGVYSTDGTVAGTTLLQATGADFVPQPGTQMVTLPNGKVLFFALANPALDPIGAIVGGIEFWETDDTAAGTTEIGTTTAPDGLETPGDTISNVVAIGNQVSFAFNIPGGGTETYLTDGTTAGTTVQSGVLLPATGIPADSAVVGSPYAAKAIFATSAGVYATDGTAAGTTLLQATGADFVPQPGTQMVTLPNGKVLFFALANPALDPIGAIVGGIEFWETDGTVAGTTEVGSTAAPDGLETPGDTISNVVAIGNQVSFAFNIPGGGTQTYLTDGTTAGTTVQYGGLLPAAGLSGGADTLCFASGTRIATPRGEVAVEHLREGDIVTTIFGGAAPVVWLGHRDTDCVHHPRPWRVWPVRVSAGAFGPNQPRRDLFLSPNHAVYVMDVLIPIRLLVNGTSIVQVATDAVTYWHVELPEHDLLLAEGLRAESYLDTGDRAQFSNGGEPVRLFPDFSAQGVGFGTLWEANGCARLVVHGPELAAARAFVDGQADVASLLADTGRSPAGRSRMAAL